MFDFVRGYGGQFVREYVLATQPHYVVGEYWDSLDYDGNVPKLNQDRHRQQTIDWITAAGGAATAFDCTTKGILHAVFEVRCHCALTTHRCTDITNALIQNILHVLVHLRCYASRLLHPCA